MDIPYINLTMPLKGEKNSEGSPTKMGDIFFFDNDVYRKIPVAGPASRIVTASMVIVPERSHRL